MILAYNICPVFLTFRYWDILTNSNLQYIEQLGWSIGLVLAFLDTYKGLSSWAVPIGLAVILQVLVWLAELCRIQI